MRLRLRNTDGSDQPCYQRTVRHLPDADAHAAAYSDGLWKQGQRTRAGDRNATAATLAQEHSQPRFASYAVDDQVCRGLPLARFEKVLARHDAKVSRQTLARWVIGAGIALHNLMRDALLDAPFIHMDETVVQVKSPTSQSYMWVQTGGNLYAGCDLRL